MLSDSIERTAWRVALTRDAREITTQRAALTARGFVVVECPVLVEAPPPDDGTLSRALNELESFDWVICASVRAVRAIARAHRGGWPDSVRTAAVGQATAAALTALAPMHPPVIPTGAGAEALWATLERRDEWRRRRVLLLTTPGGRTSLVDRLRAAGAEVVAIAAYVMELRPAEDIRRDWADARPDAAVLASPRTVDALAAAVGRDTLAQLRAIVAIGASTAAAIAQHGLACAIAAEATFDAVADTLHAVRAREVTA